jgi:hypothetical protein
MLTALLGGQSIAATASTNADGAAWFAEYYANGHLIGEPALTRQDASIDFEWGDGPPAPGILDDEFSVRWTRTATFAEGLYLFRATVDDGIRVYLDGTLLIDEWQDGGRREVTVDRQLSAGSHALRVEYYEREGEALVHFEWKDVTASTLGWRGEYWASRAMTGRPVMVRMDSNLAFDWGEGSPARSLPGDNFAARWTRRAYFEAGTYRFSVLVDDGMRLWVDGQLVLDAWRDHDSVEFAVNHALTQGMHTLRVEYYERIGKARIWVWWEKAAGDVYPQWKGEYWSNRSLSGGPVLVRNDRDINFDWGAGPPSPSLPKDTFAARWTREVPLEESLYRFHILSDDGIRLWVDGVLRYDAWRDQEAHEWTLDLKMSKGKHEIVVEYYEHGGGARVHVWWERLTSPHYPNWMGEYWPNRDLRGAPALVRNDPGVVFDWGTGAPAAALPDDNFSVRWSREETFVPGRYRFYALADDGIRVRVDDNVAIDEWHDSRGDTVYTGELALEGTRDVVVEYYEHGGNALVHVWWNRIG